MRVVDTFILPPLEGEHPPRVAMSVLEVPEELPGAVRELEKTGHELFALKTVTVSWSRTLDTWVDDDAAPIPEDLAARITKLVESSGFDW